MKYARAGRAIGYSTGYGIISLIASIALLPLVFTTVGVGQYGAWLFLISLVQYFYYGDLGVGLAVIHFSSRARGGDTSKSLDSLLSTAVAWSGIAAIVCLPIFAFSAHAYLSRDSVSDVLPSGAGLALVILSSIAVAVIAVRPYNAVLIGVGGFVTERKFQFVGLALRIIGTLVACVGFNSLIGVALAETLALVVPTLGAAIVVSKKKIANLKFSQMSIDTWREMTSYSVRSIASTLASLAAVQGGTIVAGLLGTPSSVSYYNAALRVYLGIRNVGQWCTAPFQTTLSRTYVKSADTANAVVRSATFGTLLLVASAATGVWLVSDWLIRTWLGSNVPASEIATTLNILLIGLVIFSLHGPLATASASSGRPGLFFPLQLAWAVSGAALSYIFGLRAGIIGVAWGMVIPLIIIEPLHFLVAKRSLGIDLRKWFRECFWPGLLIVGPAGLIAGLVSIVVVNGLGHNDTTGSLTILLCFALVGMLTAGVFRRFLPWRQFRQALNVEV